MTEPQKPTTRYFDAPEPQETLRDKIAMSALPAVMKQLVAVEVFDETDDEIAMRCYSLADAFLKVRDE